LKARTRPVAGLTKLFLDTVHAGIPGASMPTFAAAVSVTTVTDVDRLPVAVGLCATRAAWSWLVYMSPWLLDPDGPQRIATARALLAAARRVEAAATPAQAVFDADGDEWWRQRLALLVVIVEWATG
jgi:hypothetical protein